MNVHSNLMRGHMLIGGELVAIDGGLARQEGVPADDQHCISTLPDRGLGAVLADQSGDGAGLGVAGDDLEAHLLGSDGSGVAHRSGYENAY